jgi:hypothetical protein
MPTSTRAADFGLRIRQPPLPWTYVGEGPRGEKRSADINARAAMVARIAAGEIEDMLGKAPSRAKGGREGASPLMLLKGRTAIDGVSGSGGNGLAFGAPCAACWPPGLRGVRATSIGSTIAALLLSGFLTRVEPAHGHRPGPGPRKIKAASDTAPVPFDVDQCRAGRRAAGTPDDAEGFGEHRHSPPSDGET